MASTPYAHTLTGRPEGDWHRLETHLPDSAGLAANFASGFGAGEWGRLAGFWHNLGKFSNAFQNYLRASAGSGGGLHAAEMAGHVDHSTAGAQHAAQKAPPGRLITYCIAGHHAGLRDNEGGESSRRSIGNPRFAGESRAFRRPPPWGRGLKRLRQARGVLVAVVAPRAEGEARFVWTKI